MGLAAGFLTEEHAESFAAGRREHHRGGSQRGVCGARTRSGGACQQPPLVGHSRCLRHAGPKAARALRERQIRDLAAGRLSIADFERHEMRRATNRLRDLWKRNPWAPGATIDLGPHEGRFLVESGVARLETPLPPAVLDWLRWRYRRLQIDHRRDEEWARVVREDYPRRVREAGQPLPQDAASDVSEAEQRAPLWRIESAAHTSKRQRLDTPRAAVEPLPRELSARVLPDGLDEAALALVVAQHSETLAPLLGKCSGEAEQRALINRFCDYLANPSDPEAGVRWREAVNELRSRQ